MMLKNATFFLLLMAGVAVFALFGAFFAERGPWHGFCI